jgi:hypothetical protein
MLLNTLLAGLEVLVWRETGAPAAAILPAFALGNLALAGVLVVGWAVLLGQLRPERRPARPLLVQEVGAIYYRPLEEAREA